MKLQLVYVLISSESDFFLEEFWVSLFSLRRFHPKDKVVVLTDHPTAERVRDRPQLASMITDLKIIDLPDDYDGRLRSRTLKTSVRNLIDGDFMTIDTDTVICGSLDEVDNLPVKNIGMVPEMHGPFKNHITYKFITNELKRIYGTDVSDAPYWFNSGCMLVRDNEFTREFFKKWNEEWKVATFQKNASSDQRPLLKVDHDYGYIIECLPDTFNCQVALSIQYLHEAKILHFWHMKDDFFLDLSYSPFTSKYVYKQVKQNKDITPEIVSLIKDCKNTFFSPSMVVGRNDFEFLLSPFNTVLGRASRESKLMHVLINKFTKLTYYYLRAKAKLGK